jgi:hypothetical protein
VAKEEALSFSSLVESKGARLNRDGRSDLMCTDQPAYAPYLVNSEGESICEQPPRISQSFFLDDPVFT